MVRSSGKEKNDFLMEHAFYVLKESRAKDFYEKHGFAYKSNTPTHYFMIWDPRAHWLWLSEWCA